MAIVGILVSSFAADVVVDDILAIWNTVVPIIIKIFQLFRIRPPPPLAVPAQRKTLEALHGRRMEEVRCLFFFFNKNGLLQCDHARVSGTFL